MITTELIDKIFDKSDEIYSPSGRYKLVITLRYYKTNGEKYINYSVGTIIRLDDGKIMTEFDRRQSLLNYKFFYRRTPNCDATYTQHEWMFAEKTYTSQYFINLDTGDEYDNEKE